MIFLVALFAYFFAFALIPTVSLLGWRIGAIDRPKDWRRMHQRPVPRCGGLAVFLSFFTASLFLSFEMRFLISAFCGGAVLLIFGLADDIFALSPWSKLIVQLVAAFLSVFSYGTYGWKGIFSAFWLLLLINAHNFVDGLDGLFAGTACIEGIALFFALGLIGRIEYSFFALLLAAACFGFRYFNQFPAKIFAGDCGSQTVGFLLGFLSLPLFEGQSPSLGWLAPFFVFAYPLTDLFCAVLRRLLRGKNPFCADRAHLHHRICDAGLFQFQSTRVLLLLSAVLGGIGVLLCCADAASITSVFCFLVAFLLVRLRKLVLQFSERN
jgi:UDP-GlcNAc:undecaprenyl-phosphate GlcNAc-1-phosphate transferase